jgi:hypothetical protein
LPDELLEPFDVELARLDAQQVRVAACLEPLGAEELAQAMDVDLKRVSRRRGWIVAPERFDQAVTSDGLVRVQKQEREERPLLRSAAAESCAAARDLERPQDTEFDPQTP